MPSSFVVPVTFSSLGNFSVVCFLQWTVSFWGAKKTYCSLYMQTSFHGASLYCLLRYCVFYKQKVYGNPTSSKSLVNVFTSSICSLHVSVSHFGNSCSAPNLFIIVVFLMVTCDQWSLILLQPAKGSDQSVQLLSRVWLFATPWTSPSVTNSRSLLKPMTFTLVISSNHLISVVPFSSCLQSCPSGPFPVSQFFTLGGQSIGASTAASVLPMKGSGDR